METDTAPTQTPLPTPPPAQEPVTTSWQVTTDKALHQTGSKPTPPPQSVRPLGYPSGGLTQKKAAPVNITGGNFMATRRPTAKPTRVALNVWSFTGPETAHSHAIWRKTLLRQLRPKSYGHLQGMPKGSQILNQN
ncbi:hypothetical protein EVAR_56318_1 [Eumeta japonica]|uniref:Uncharacterized protein n=1 Tax=Eumeta variegata TaxID=151549 RepID=A0A4C1YG75_EUMVA|nr:hypothetical protein EVAR_56318_1 [Eumeta japonica]